MVTGGEEGVRLKNLRVSPLLSEEDVVLFASPSQDLQRGLGGSETAVLNHISSKSSLWVRDKRSLARSLDHEGRRWIRVVTRESGKQNQNSLGTQVESEGAGRSLDPLRDPV